jgi:hypothetical protein
VTWQRPSQDRIPDGEIAASLGMQQRVVGQCGSVFASPGTPDLYDRAQLDRACTFVLTTLRLQPPQQPLPVFLRDAAQNAHGDIPLAAPVVIAIDAEDGPSTNTLDTLAHEFTHGLGGTERDIGNACLEEGIARFMGRLFVGRDAPLRPDALTLLRAGATGPGQLVAADAMYGGSPDAVAQHYAVCAGFVLFLIDRFDGSNTLVELYRTGHLRGQAIDELAATYVASTR